MLPALETIGATGKENESKYRSGRGTGLLKFTERDSGSRSSINKLKTEFV